MKKIFCLGLSIVFAVCLTACGELDTSSDISTTEDNTSIEQVIEKPSIMSEDSVMPKYLDISLYDEENYANVYLGEDFEYDITYCEKAFAVPTDYEKILTDGWKLIESEEYNENTQILTGKLLTVDFVNEDNKKITVVFQNNHDSSEALKDCKPVRFLIKENALIKNESEYGNFWINGISNTSAITDMIEVLGVPSHFYCISGSDYYLDWFITKEDRRSCITIYVDTAEDDIQAVEFSYY